MRAYENIRQIAASQRYDFTTSCLLDYQQKETYNLIKIDLSKQKILDADPKQTEQTTFPGNLDQAEETKMFFNVKKVQETIVNFLQVSVKVNLFYRFIQTVI